MIVINDQNEQILLPNEAAEMLQYTPKTLSQMSSTGKIPVIKRGKKRFYLKSQLIAYIMGAAI